MTSTSGPRLDPAPLFDLVTGFPPADAIDVTLPMPLSLAVYMTMLESTGHAAELALLRKTHLDEARETARRLRAGIGPVRITHIVEERVPRVNGLRPHVHAFVGSPVDVEQVAALAHGELYDGYRDRLATATTEGDGLVWSARELVGSRWLAERTEDMRRHGWSCPGPWPRPQIVAGQPGTVTPARG